MYLLHPHWCYATSAFHSTYVFDLMATTQALNITTYHWPTTQSQHVHMANTPLDHHPHHCPYLYKTLISTWVGKLLFGLSECKDEGTRMLWNTGNFDPQQHSTTTFQSFIYLCAGIAQPVWWLGCRLDNRDLNPHGSQKFSSSPGDHPASYATGTTALSLGIIWPVPETDHSPPNAKVMNEWRNTSTPLVCLHSMHRDITLFS